MTTKIIKYKEKVKKLIISWQDFWFGILLLILIFFPMNFLINNYHTFLGFLGFLASILLCIISMILIVNSFSYEEIENIKEFEVIDEVIKK